MPVAYGYCKIEWDQTNLIASYCMVSINVYFQSNAVQDSEAIQKEP